MTYKLFYILLAVLIGTMLSIVANLFTNNKEVNQWLEEKGIGAKKLSWGVALATFVLAIIAYLQYQSDQETKPLYNRNDNVNTSPAPKISPIPTLSPNTPTPTPVVTPIPATPTPVMPPVIDREIKFGQTLFSQSIPQFEPDVEYYFKVDNAHVNKEVTITIVPEAGFQVNVMLLNNERDPFRPNDRSKDEYRIVTFSPRFSNTYYIKITPRKSNGKFNISLE